MLSLNFSLPPSAFAEGGRESAVALSTLLEETLSNNQQLKAAESTAERYKTRIVVFELLTEPIQAFYYLGFPVGTISGGLAIKDHQGTSGVAKRMEVQGRRGNIMTGRDMVEDMATWYERQADELRLELTMQVQQAFYRTYFLDQILEILKESISTLESLIQSGRAQYSVGKISQKDLLKLQNRSYQLTARLIELQRQRQQLATKVNYLAGRSPSNELIPEVPGGFEYEDLVEPKYSIRELVSGVQRYRPLTKGYQALGARFNSMRGMVQMFFNRDVRTEAGYEVETGLRALRAEAADFFNDSTADIKITMDNLTQYKELARIYGKVLIPQSRAIYQANLADIKVGKGDFRETLESILDLNNYQVSYFEALSNYQVGMAQLERISSMQIDKPSS